MLSGFQEILLKTVTVLSNTILEQLFFWIEEIFPPGESLISAGFIAAETRNAFSKINGESS